MSEQEFAPMRFARMRRLVPVVLICACLTLVAGACTPTVASDESSKSPGQMVPEHYDSVDAMLAAQPFYIAHRGGSANWPEFSMSAYSQAVDWGVGALELSVSRTADGVFFGLHDATLDRTSEVSGNVDPTKLTWGALTSQYKNKLNAPTPSGVDYTSANDIFAAFAKDHVIFVDPKYVGNTEQRTDLIKLMLSYAPADHWVLKGYYDDSSLTPLAHQYGIRTWGYYFPGDVAKLDQTADNWDMLGLQVSASDAQWQQVKAKGKPVIAFFISNQSELAEANRKGANGMMVSDVPATLGSPRKVAAGPLAPSFSEAVLVKPTRQKPNVTAKGKRLVKKRKVVKRTIRAAVTVPSPVNSRQVIRLQQKVHGKWVTVRTTRTSFANTTRTVTRYTVKRNLRYRVCAVANDKIARACTGGIRVR